MQHLAIETIIDYLHGDLAAEADAQAFVHFSECEICRSERELEATATERLRAFASASEREFPASLATSIFAAVKPVRKAWLPATIAGLRTAFAVPALGGVLTLALGGIFFLSHPLVPQHSLIAATAFLDRHLDATTQMPLGDHVNAPTFESSAALADVSEGSGTENSI